MNWRFFWSEWTVIQRKKYFYYSFHFNICSIYFVLFLCRYVLLIFLCILSLSRKFRSLDSPFRFVWAGKREILSESKSWNNGQSRMEDENFSKSAQNMKNRLKFPIEEVKEKWYAELLAAIYQIHCICRMYTQKKRRRQKVGKKNKKEWKEKKMRYKEGKRMAVGRGTSVEHNKLMPRQKERKVNSNQLATKTQTYGFDKNRILNANRCQRFLWHWLKYFKCKWMTKSSCHSNERDKEMEKRVRGRESIA